MTKIKDVLLVDYENGNKKYTKIYHTEGLTHYTCTCK